MVSTLVVSISASSIAAAFCCSSPRALALPLHHLPLDSSLKSSTLKPSSPNSLCISFALAESDPSKSFDDGDGDGDDALSLLRELSVSLILPPDYLSQLSRDLRLDLNDAAFDLANRPVIKEIAKIMIKTGNVLSASPVTIADENKPKMESRMLKFGELQVELTPQKANLGSAIALVFGILSWELSQGIHSIPESSLQYANDNALLLAKSLRGALLVLGYTSTILSAYATGGLILLGMQLSSESKSKEQ